MKKFALAALVAVFLLGSVNTASAEFSSAGGRMLLYYNWADNANFAKKDGEDDFQAAQNTRMYFDYTASENLMANIKLEIDQVWGRAGTVATSSDGATVTGTTDAGSSSGGDLGADGVNIETKSAYIKWTVPDTDMTMQMGIQGVALPSATYGNVILDADAAAAVASNKFNDQVSATLLWVRAGDTAASDTATSSTADEFDVVGLVLPIAFDGGTITPYGAIGVQGKDNYGNSVTDTVDYRYYGAALSVTAFDPITIGVDFAHGSRDTSLDAQDAKGWFLAADVTYKMDMVTASLVGFTSSGNDANTADGSETLPMVSGGTWAPTTFATDGDYSGFGTSYILTAGPGAQGIGIKLSDLSFMENMTHKINLFYYQGTAKSGAAAALPWGGAGTVFTKKDSAVEINFESKYAIYENLAAVLDVSMVDVDFKKSGIGARTTATSTDADETALKGTIQFQYSF